MSKPTILLVHGAWHTPHHYTPFTTALQHLNFEVLCPLLPTCTNTRPPTSDLHADVAVIRSTLTSLVEAGKSVIVVAHSYGGIVTSNALPGLSRRERAEKGLKGGVVHLVYMCAFLCPIGGTVSSAVVAEPSPIEVDEDGTSSVIDPRHLFYADCTAEQAKEASEGLTKHAIVAFGQAVAHEPWRDVALTYVFCTEDEAIPMKDQRRMVGVVKEEVDKEGKEGVMVREETYECGHSPFLSRVGEMVEVVGRVAEGC